jgi:hypothetical protein
VSSWPPVPAVVVATVRGSAQSKQSGTADGMTYGSLYPACGEPPDVEAPGFPIAVMVEFEKSPTHAIAGLAAKES